MRIEASYAPSGETVIGFVEEVAGVELRRHTPLRLAGHLPGMTGDRLAVAVTLLLGSSIGTSLDVGKPVSRRVADAIAVYLNAPSLQVGRDEPASYAHNAGGDLVLADAPRLTLSTVAIPERRSMTVVELPNHASAGNLLANGNWILSTNSWVHQLSVLTARLAVPVLLAHHVSASRLIVPASAGRDLSEADKVAVAELLISTDLAVRWRGELDHD